MSWKNTYQSFDSKRVDDLEHDFDDIEYYIYRLGKNLEKALNEEPAKIESTFSTIESIQNQVGLLENFNAQAYQNQINNLDGKKGIITTSNNGLPVLDSQESFLAGSLWLILES